LVGRHKSTRAYTIEYFEQIASIAGGDDLLIVPNVATEASNLLRHANSGGTVDRLMAILRRLIDTSQEVYVPSESAARDVAYPRLGLADCAILLALGRRSRLLTADHGLHQEALRRGFRAENFWHLVAVS